VRSSCGSSAKRGVGGRRVRKTDRQEPDLGLGAWVDPGAEARGEELGSEAGAEKRNARPNRLGDEALLSHEPGMLQLVVHAHRTAHGDDEVELAPRWQGLALVELDTMDGRSSLPQHLLVDPGGLAGDVLEDESVHLRFGSRLGHAGRYPSALRGGKPHVRPPAHRWP
jgi:hypothetical protein